MECMKAKYNETRCALCLHENKTKTAVSPKRTLTRPNMTRAA